MQLLKRLKGITFRTVLNKMKKFIFILILTILNSCTPKESQIEHNTSINIRGTWKMVYAETIENDSLRIKNLTKTTFIKIINNSHFAFFNQEFTGNENFYSGAGTYTLKETIYIETLNFTSVESIKNHQFPFKVTIKGDTLIQSGLEEIKAEGIKRKIVEKYIRIK